MTPEDPVGAVRYVLVGVLVLGLLAVFAGPIMVLIGRTTHSGRTGPPAGSTVNAGSSSGLNDGEASGTKRSPNPGIGTPPHEKA